MLDVTFDIFPVVSNLSVVIFVYTIYNCINNNITDIAILKATGANFISQGVGSGAYLIISSPISNAIIDPCFTCPPGYYWNNCWNYCIPCPSGWDVYKCKCN